MNNSISSSIKLINPSSILDNGFEFSDQIIIPNKEFNGEFTPNEDTIELFIYDFNKNIIESNYKFTNYSINNDTIISPSGTLDTIQLYPSDDLIYYGYDQGKYYSVYNFIHYELSSSTDLKYYIKDISSDRTEIRISSNFISSEDTKNSYNDFISKLNSQLYFDEFYISFPQNENFIAINILLEDDNNVLIKLYTPLPDDFKIKDELSIITKPAESLAYEIDLVNYNLFGPKKNFISGPNINISLKDEINNSTDYKSFGELTSATLTGSLNELSYFLERKGVEINPDYSYDTFDEFTNFSSAKKRIQNFVSKVTDIQSYQNDITLLGSITGSTTSSLQVSNSIHLIESNISNIIKNFDGYEYYLYFESSSYSYPKSTSNKPYTLFSTGSVESLTWVGSDDLNNQYYGGIILSASLYDNTNPNYIYYTIPEFIRDNSDNDNYVDFVNMLGQHFDNIWLYIKYITEKSNTTNELDKGIPLQLVNEAIKSLGFEEITNNYNNWDNFISLTGLSPDGTIQPQTGSELITDYIAINAGNISSSWNPDYEFLDTFSYPLNNISKELYKRLYHNMSYLVKKKGTISGLRQLINIWGIPNTILRINEFGGQNRDNTNDYDNWYNRYSYAFDTRGKAVVHTPWTTMWSNGGSPARSVPDSIQFRFKTTGYPSSSENNLFTQSLLLKKSDDNSGNNFDFGVYLYYSGSQSSGSYSGSAQDDYRNYGQIKFYISASTEHGGLKTSDPISLPFFNKEWWSVMLQRNNHVSQSDNSQDTIYTLYVKNNVYNGYDGNGIGFQGSASITSTTSSNVYGSASYGTGSYGSYNSINRAWNSVNSFNSLAVPYDSLYNGLYLGGYVSGSSIGGITLSEPNKLFSGSFQELRLYSTPLSESIFDSFTMNPESIEGLTSTGSNSSFDVLRFRAPLGNELESKFETTTNLYHTQSFESLHPSNIDTSDSLLLTGSFALDYSAFGVLPTITSSNYVIEFLSSSFAGAYSEPITQTYYSNQFTSGLKNNINNKIQIVESSSYGTILSSQKSIQQEYLIDKDYTNNTNYLEVAFSPQNQINEDIIQSLGNNTIQNILGDPRNISSSQDYYVGLRKIAEDYFKKYDKGNIYDYLRLIKYFDNSLFKAIKNYVPARTSLSTGIVIKQHLLERNRQKPLTLNVYYSQSTYSILTGSIDVATITGGTGGSLNQFNYLGSSSWGQIENTQSWTNSFDTKVGLLSKTEDAQKEFYDGEYSGSCITVTTQSLNPDNIFKNSLFTESAGIVYYSGSTVDNVYNGGDNTYWSASLGSVTLAGQQIRSQSPSQSYDGIYSVEFSSSVFPMVIYFSSSLYSNPPIYPSGNLNMKVYLSVYPTSSLFYIGGTLEGHIVGSYTLINPYIVTSSLNTWQSCTIPIASMVVPNTPIDSIAIISYNSPDTGSQLFFDDISVDFSTIFTPSSSYNDFNPVLNNAVTSRNSTLYRDVDYSYDYKTPVNIQAIVSGSASFSQVPDSNYTSKRVINPRYDGTRVRSLDYNKFTPPGTVEPNARIILGLNQPNIMQYFLNGDTGSYDGDISYGRNSVIDVNPTYFAHFKHSNENYNLWGTYTYTLDQLILIPDEDIRSLPGYQPITIQLENNKENILDVSSVFARGRTVNAIYDSVIYGGIDYNKLKVGGFEIFQGGLDFQTLNTNEKDPLNFSPSSSYIKFKEIIKIDNVDEDVIQMGTGSNSLILSGSTAIVRFYRGNNDPTANQCVITGSHLATIHNYNQFLYNNKTKSSPQPINPNFKLFVDLGLDATSQDNYYTFSPNASESPAYDEPGTPFLILPGDEIRVTYLGASGASGGNRATYNQDFTVLGYSESSQSIAGHATNNYKCTAKGIDFSIGAAGFEDSFDTIHVTPDPSTLSNPIPSGNIFNFTIRRRIEVSNKIIVKTNSPSGSMGQKTRSGGGFLIPDDVSQIQKENILFIINQLNSKNAFRNSDTTI